MGVDRLERGAAQPFYNVIVHGDRSSRYAAEGMYEDRGSGLVRGSRFRPVAGILPVPAAELTSECTRADTQTTFAPPPVKNQTSITHKQSCRLLWVALSPPHPRPAGT